MEQLKNMDELTIELKTTNNEIAIIEQEISKKVASFQGTLATLREKDAELRLAIKDGMEQNGVKKFENDFIAITYVAPTTRTTLDSAKIRIEQPEMFEKYSKQSDVKSSVRIKIKEEQ